MNRFRSFLGGIEVGSKPYRRILWGLLTLGVVVRIILAFATYGAAFDIDSLRIAADTVADHGFHLYAYLQDHFNRFRWPYPGGFLPIDLVGRAIADATPLPFHGLIQIPSILADLGIAWAVQYWLARIGRPATECLGAAALVVLGPIFVLISGYHGQIDAVTILPAVAAVILWMRGGERRALHAGLLVGLAASVKTVPLFMLLAMLPTARTKREALVLVAGAVLIPALSVLPFALVEPQATIDALRSDRALLGIGGISLFVQPDLADFWIRGEEASISSLSLKLADLQNMIVGIGVLCAGAFSYWRRLSAIDAAALIWLTVYVVNPAWSFQYLVWGLPFFLMARRYLEVLILQVVLIPPVVLLYFHFGVGKLGWSYLPTMFVIWLALLTVLIDWVWRLGRGLDIGPDWSRLASRSDS